MKKMNNKGFSLVELIVVIAIMGILAVTLAPRLTSYIEKSRKAADSEVVNTIMTATKLGFAEQNIFDAFTTNTNTVATGTPATSYSLDLNTNAYTVTAKSWVVATPATTDAFLKQLYDVVGDFNLKSKDASGSTEIKIDYVIATDTITVSIDYDADGTAEYSVASK